MKQLKYVLILLVVPCLLASANPVFATPFQDQLKTSIDKLVDVLKDPQYQGQENLEKRRDMLRAIIHERFSFSRMSQLSLGKHWRQISPEEKDEFISLFGRLLEKTYVSRIESYNNEEVIYTKTSEKNNKAQVDTKIITESLEIPINYRMYMQSDGSWKVYDIVVEGVSLVGNYRSQFNQVLRKNSFETLMEDLKKRLDS